MKKSAVFEEARSYFLPVLLGSNRLSHKISRRIYGKYRISSLTLDTHRGWRDLCDISSRFIPLCSKEPQLLGLQLRQLAESQTYTLPLLIATDGEYEALVDKISDGLESSYIICDPNTLFTSSPLANIK